MFPALFALLALAVDGPVQYKFLLTNGAQITTSTVDADGNVYFGGSTSVALPTTPGVFQERFAPCAAVPSGQNQIGHRSCNWAFVGKLAPDGSIVWLTYIAEPNGNSRIENLAIDTKKNVYVVATSQLVDGKPAALPVSAGSFDPRPDSYYVAALDASGKKLIYATYLPLGSAGFSLQPDANGNLYIGISSGVGLTLPAINPIPGTALDGFGYLAKLNASGTALILGTGLSTPGASARPFRLTMDAAGSLYVVGGCQIASSQAPCVPTTPGAYQSQSASTGNLFAMKLTGDGTLAYSTLTNIAGSLTTIAVDSGGNLVLSGWASSEAAGTPSVPTTPGAFQTTVLKRNRQGSDTGFITKLNATGTGLVFSTYFGGSSYDYVLGAGIGSGGDVIFGGQSYSPDLPMSRDAWQPCHPLPNFNYANGGGASFVAKMSADGRTLKYASFFGGGEFNASGIVGFAVALAGVDASGDLYLYGNDGELPVIVRYRMTPLPRGSASCVASATHGYEVPVSSLGLVKIRGYDVSGGRTLAPTLTSAGTLPQISNGLQVFIGGFPASLLEMSADDITVIAPTQLPPFGSTLVTVVQDSLVTSEIEVDFAPAAPAIITSDGSGFGYALALNQDGTVNSQDHPAAQGSIVSLYMTGLGQANPPSQFQSGMVATFTGTLLEAVQVTLYRDAADVLYAGPAPGLLAGFYQVNIPVPSTAYQDWVPLSVAVADRIAQSQPGNAEVGLYVSCPSGSTCVRWP